MYVYATLLNTQLLSDSNVKRFGYVSRKHGTVLGGLLISGRCLEMLHGDLAMYLVDGRELFSGLGPGNVWRSQLGYTGKYGGLSGEGIWQC